MKIVITGGHHTSAIPVIKKLKKIEPEIDIYWFGHKYSQKGNRKETLEYREIVSLGIEFHELKAGKLYKTYDLGRLLKIPFGFFQSLSLLRQIKPDVILSFGGYLAVPVVLAGWIKGISSITHEQTVVSGYANKLISIFAKKVMISWEESRQYFPKDKVLYVGLPLRNAIFEVRSDKLFYGNKLPLIYITAGKTGSHKINKAVFECMENLLNEVNIVHQCGDHSEYMDYEALMEKYENIKDNVPGMYFARKFVYEDEIGEVYDKSSLVVSRSGAHTVAEFLALSKPCILIPIPWVSHNEQCKNAEILVKAGIAKILQENELTCDNLIKGIKGEIARKHRVNHDPEKFRKLCVEAPDLIANEVFEIIKNKK